MLTFDGSRYDCQGQGEFLLTKAASTGSEVQVRFQPWSRNPTSAVTVTTAMVAREEGSSIVQVNLAASGSSLEVIVDGEAYDEAAGSATGVVLDVAPSQVQMSFLSGMDIFVTYRYAFLMVSTYVPLDLPMIGLLGNNNGEIADDWMVSTPSTTRWTNIVRWDAHTNKVWKTTLCSRHALAAVPRPKLPIAAT